MMFVAGDVLSRVLKMSLFQCKSMGKILLGSTGIFLQFCEWPLEKNRHVAVSSTVSRSFLLLLWITPTKPEFWLALYQETHHS